jgi:hypothetical protein
MNTSLIQVYQCDCNPGKHYKTKQTYQKHFQSKKHCLFEEHNNKVGHVKRIQSLEVELQKVTRERDIWKDKFFEIDLLRSKLKVE